MKINESRHLFLGGLGVIYSLNRFVNEHDSDWISVLRSKNNMIKKRLHWKDFFSFCGTYGLLEKIINIIIGQIKLALTCDRKFLDITNLRQIVGEPLIIGYKLNTDGSTQWDQFDISSDARHSWWSNTL